MAALIALRRLRCDKGAELVEFALVLPMLLLLMMGIIDFGLLFRNYEVLTNAAREGARIRVLPGYTNADAEARVTQYLAASGMTGTPTFTPLPLQAVNVGGACITLTGITVTYNHQFAFVGPVMAYLGTPLSTTPLTATARMRFEAGALACP